MAYSLGGLPVRALSLGVSVSTESVAFFDDGQKADLTAASASDYVSTFLSQFDYFNGELRHSYDQEIPIRPLVTVQDGLIEVDFPNGIGSQTTITGRTTDVQRFNISSEPGWVLWAADYNDVRLYESNNLVHSLGSLPGSYDITADHIRFSLRFDGDQITASIIDGTDDSVILTHTVTSSASPGTAASEQHVWVQFRSGASGGTADDIRVTDLSAVGGSVIAAPTGFGVTAAENAILIDWDDHTDPAVTSYEVEVDTVTPVTTSATATTPSALTVSGTAGVPLYARVRGVTATGFTAWTTFLTATPTSSSNPPPTPSNFVFKNMKLGAGGYVTGVYATSDPNVWYCRTDVGGCYRSDDAKANWTQLITTASISAADADASRDQYDSVKLTSIDGLCVDPTDPLKVWISVGNEETIVAAPYYSIGKVFRSVDGGDSWTSSTTSFSIAGNNEYRQETFRLARNPVNGDIWLGTRRQGLWRSTDGGDNFTQIPDTIIPYVPPNSLSSEAGITGVVFDGTDMYVGVAGLAIHKSTDNGATFSNIRTLLDYQVPTSMQVSQGHLFTGLSCTYTYVSGSRIGQVWEYDGSAWTDLTQTGGFGHWNLCVNPTDRDEYFMVSDALRPFGAIRYTTDGTNFTAVPTNTLTSSEFGWITALNHGGYMPVGRLMYNPHDLTELVCAHGIGVSSADISVATFPNALDWEFQSTNIEELVTSNILSPPGEDLAIGVADFGVQMRDKDLPFDTPAASQVFGSQFAGCMDIDYSGGTPSTMVAIALNYATYPHAPYASRTTDGGATWTALGNLNEDMYGGNIAISATDPDNMVWVASHFGIGGQVNDPHGLFITDDALATAPLQITELDGVRDFNSFRYFYARRAVAADRVDGSFYLCAPDGSDAAFWYSQPSAKGATWVKQPYTPPMTFNSASQVYGRLLADPDTAQIVWASCGSNGLFRSGTGVPGSSPWEKLIAVNFVDSFSFGAPISPSTHNTIFVHGKCNGEPHLSLYRSVDNGATFQELEEGRYPAGMWKAPNIISGDMNVPGRVHVGFGGLGAVTGDPVLATPPAETTTWVPSFTADFSTDTTDVTSQFTSSYINSFSISGGGLIHSYDSEIPFRPVGTYGPDVRVTIRITSGESTISQWARTTDVQRFNTPISTEEGWYFWQSPLGEGRIYNNAVDIANAQGTDANSAYDLPGRLIDLELTCEGTLITTKVTDVATGIVLAKGSAVSSASPGTSALEQYLWTGFKSGTDGTAITSYVIEEPAP